MPSAVRVAGRAIGVISVVVEFGGVAGFVLAAALVSVTVGAGVISWIAIRGSTVAGVTRPGRKGDRFVVLRVLGTLLARLRWGVGLRL